MRVALLIFFILLSLLSPAQAELVKQIKSIIKDSSNNFQSFKGSFLNLQEKDSVFASLITIEGTSKNDILVSNEMVIYRAIVVDSVNEKRGKKIVDQWQQTISGILSGKFKHEKIKVVDWNPGKYGWNFINGNVSIGITLYSLNPEATLYWVCFGITRFKPE